jgi:hypothetical protein
MSIGSSAQAEPPAPKAAVAPLRQLDLKVADLSVKIRMVVDETMPPSSRVASTVEWELETRPISHRPYLYMSLVPWVRLSKSICQAFPPGASLPFGLPRDRKQLAVICPLSEERRGNFKVIPLQGGRLTIAASLLAVRDPPFKERDTTWKEFMNSRNKDDPDTEVSWQPPPVLEKRSLQQTMSLDVRDKPRLVVQNVYEIPALRRIESPPSEGLSVRVYKHHFDVVVAKTGGKIFSASGHNPRFSNTGRFLTYCSLDNDLEEITVVDLLDGAVLLRTTAQIVAWSKSDRVALFAKGDWGRVEGLFPWLGTDGKTRLADGCHACPGWAEDITISNHKFERIGRASLRSLREDHQMGRVLPDTPPDKPGWHIGEPFVVTHVHPTLRESASRYTENPPDGWPTKDMADKLTTLLALSPENDESIPPIPTLAKPTARPSRPVPLPPSTTAQQAVLRRLKDYGLALRPNLIPSAMPASWVSVPSHRQKEVCDPENTSGHVGVQRWVWKAPTAEGIREITLERHMCAAGAYGYGEEMRLKVDLAGKTKEVVLDEAGFFLTMGRGPEYLFGDLVTAFLSDWSTLTIARPISGQAVVLDLATGVLRGRFSNLGDLGYLESFQISSDGRSLVEIGTEGSIAVFDIARSMLLVRGVYIDDEIIFFTPTGYYDSTPEGAEHVSWYFPETRRHVPFSHYAQSMNRPDQIRAALQGSQAAPPFDIASLPEVRLEIESGRPGTIRATARASSTSAPLARIVFAVDGMEASRTESADREGLAETVLSPPRGARWLSALAIDDRGTSSLVSSLPLPARLGRESARAAIVAAGIDNYPGRPEGNLIFAWQDAKAVAGELRRQTTRRFTLSADAVLGPTVLRADLVAALTRAAESVGEGGSVFFYFAGHASQIADGDLRLLTSPGVGIEATSSAGADLTWRDLLSIPSLARRRLVVFLDVCHAGAAGMGQAAPGLETSPQARGGSEIHIALIAAAKSRQASAEPAGRGGRHGAFAQALLSVLAQPGLAKVSDRNAAVEIRKFFSRLRRQVVALTHGRQVPTLRLSGLIGPMPLF